MDWLKLDGIVKSFGGGPVLDKVAWSLRPGEVHVLAGENGAGKTTLIKILAGVHAPDAGRILFEGRPVRFRTPREAAALGVSAIHQDTSLVLTMNVSDNIFLGRETVRSGGRMDFRAQRVRAKELLARLGLDLDPDAPVGDFPVSVRQMIEIAKALAFEARVLIMDEPTSALNETETARLFDIIRDLKGRGCAIVFISHRLDEIYAVGDFITVLRDGRNAGEARLADLPPDRLVAWMVGREISQQYPTRRPAWGPVVLEVRGLSVPASGGRRGWAASDISFDLRRGEILGLAGLQGSGKSELAHGLFGSLGPGLRGRISLEGRPFHPRTPAASIRRGLALLTSDRKGSGLVPVMSVGRNITLASLPALSPRGWIRAAREQKAAEAAFKAFDIRARSLDQDVSTLSGGNQQKVVLAKWLETSPRVLLLDEPTIGVDVGAKHEIYNLMNRWTAEGLAILLITSDLPELLALSDRVLVMHRGRTMAVLDRAEATQERVLAAAMGREERT